MGERALYKVLAFYLIQVVIRISHNLHEWALIGEGVDHDVDIVVRGVMVDGDVDEVPLIVHPLHYKRLIVLKSVYIWSK